MTSLLILVLALQDAKARYAEANARLNAHVWEERLDLGDWCKSRGLFADAAAHYTFVRDHVPGPHPLNARAEKGLRGSWKSKPDTSTDQTRAEHGRRLDAYVKEAGERAFACYKIAKAGGLKDIAAVALARTLEFDIDQPDARRERGEMKLDGFGWVPQAEEKEWAAAPRSEHFLLHIDGNDAAAALEHLERVYAAFHELTGGRFAPLPERMGVCWLRDGAAFERVRARVPGAPGPGSIAFYSAVTHVAYARGDLATLTHEVVHGLCDLGAGAFRSSLLTAGLRGDARRDYWVVEGIACYVATYREGTFTGPELSAGTDFDAFMKMGFEEFMRDSLRNYVTAHALVRSLLAGPRREKFLDFARDFYAGRGDFARTVGPAVAAPSPDDRIAQIVDRITFPTADEARLWTSKGPEYKRLLDVFLNRSQWMAAIRAVEQRLGPFGESWNLTVRLGDWEGAAMGSGERVGDRAEVAFNMRGLGEYERGLEDQRRRAEKLGKEGKLPGYQVPPTSYAGMIRHELTHIWHGDYKAPPWFLEGLATWVAADECYAIAFAHAGKEVQSIEVGLPDWHDQYPRGLAFFKWLENRAGAESVGKLFKATCVDGGEWKAQIERATGLEWAKVVEAEKAWSTQYVRRRKPR